MAKSDRPRKRAKTSKDDEGEVVKQRRRRAGKLSLIMTIPIDVFCEIAGHLSPEDLLCISRASKALRNLLISKSFKAVWTAAERAVGLPPCPPDLSCPQYASLLFDKFCMSCLANQSKYFGYHQRARLCRACESTELVTGEDLVPEGMDLLELSALIPGSARWIGDESWFERAYTSSDPREREKLSQRFYRPHIVTACQEYVAFDKERKAEILIERSKDIFHLHQHAYKVGVWLSMKKDEKSKAIVDARRTRRESILCRLSELGYTEDELDTGLDEEGWKWTTLIDQPRALTDRIWNNVRPQLEETLRLRREKRHQLAREECLKQRILVVRHLGLSVLRSDKGKFCLLSFGELLKFPLFKDFLEADGLDATIDEGRGQLIKERILDLGIKMKREVNQKAASDITAEFSRCGLLPSDTQAPDETLQENFIVLQHSCAFFRCETSYGAFARSFSKVLRAFAEATKESYVEVESKPIDYLSTLDAPYRRAIMVAKRMVEELEIENSTMRELLELGDFFVCTRCDPLLRRKRDWVSLIEHFCDEMNKFKKAVSSSLCNQQLRSFFLNDHCLDTDHRGRSVALLNRIENASETKKLFKRCRCRSCNPSQKGSVHILHHTPCPICQRVRVLDFFTCEQQMLAHIRNRHSTLPIHEVMAALGLKWTW